MSYLKQTDEGLEISVVRAQRIYNNHQWPNPIVVKLENIEPALEPAKFETLPAELTGVNMVRFSSEIREMGSGKAHSICFEFRRRVSSLDKKAENPWARGKTMVISKVGDYSMDVKNDMFSSLIPKAEDTGSKPTASDVPKGIEFRARSYFNISVD